MKTYELSEELVNVIMGYLAQKPYIEVVKLILAIHRETTAVVPGPERPREEAK